MLERRMQPSDPPCSWRIGRHRHRHGGRTRLRGMLVDEFAARNIDRDGARRTMTRVGHHVQRRAARDPARLVDPGGGCRQRRGHRPDGAIRARNDRIPIFLLTERGKAKTLTIEMVEAIDELVWLPTTPRPSSAAASKPRCAIYTRSLFGPLTTALYNFSQVNEYSWHTPGHTGGTAFLKHPAGRAFFDFYGENLFRTDLSISVGALGSLLDHTGPIGASERYIAEIFGSHRSYTVTNGSSTSNRIIFMACVGRDQVVLCDRNCHKSHRARPDHDRRHPALPGAVAQPLRPDRPDLPGGSPKADVRKAVAANPLSKNLADKQPVFAVVTNSTYDGFATTSSACRSYAGQLGGLHALRRSLVRLRALQSAVRQALRHAWRSCEHDPKGPTVFSTHSTHKLLAALSQASYIHVREGRRRSRTRGSTSRS
jgi:arginine decarboxylase